jgi:hypothetical protein
MKTTLKATSKLALLIFILQHFLFSITYAQCPAEYPINCVNFCCSQDSPFCCELDGNQGCCPAEYPYCGYDNTGQIKCFKSPPSTTTSIKSTVIITRVDPPYAYIGENARIEIGLSDTSFFRAQLSAKFSGSGITVVSVQENLNSIDSIFVDIIVNPNAEFGFRDVTIQINSETTSKSNAIYLIGEGCEPAYPVRCSNYCCPADYPYCGLGNKCYSQPQQPGACVAEAALEDDADSLSILRNFRDKVLMKSENGRKYVDLYYQYSSIIVTLIEHNPELKQQVRTAIMTIMPTIKQRLKEMPRDK